MLTKIFKALTKEIDNNWREKTYYDETLKTLNKNIKKLDKRITNLEQGYPNEEELKKLKVGGTD